MVELGFVGADEGATVGTIVVCILARVHHVRQPHAGPAAEMQIIN